jgi:8-oxo-dGTP pyrophosphatase MutT (NUDIX family)
MNYKNLLKESIADDEKVKRRVNAAAGVIMRIDENGRKQILLIQRSPEDHWPHHWEFPRGKCDHGKSEEIIPCAKREIKEETGLNVRVVSLIDKFQYLADGGERLTTCYNYLCEIDPPDQTIKLSKEHQDHKWVSEIGEVEMLVLPDQKKTIEKVLNGDRPMVTYPDNDFTQNNKVEENTMEDGNKPLNKPFRLPAGSKKKFGVYVKNDKGNVVKVTFGDPNLEIKRDDPNRLKSFRARHGCDNPGPRWKAKYWSCKFWEKNKPVSKLLKRENKMDKINQYLSYIVESVEEPVGEEVTFEPKNPLYEKVLYMVAEAKWQRKLAQGLMKKADLRRIQKHVGRPDPLYVKSLLKQGKKQAADAYLKKRGLVKSAASWLAGVERGTKNILKKTGAKVVHKPDTTFHKATTASGMADYVGLKKGKTMRNPLGAHAKVTQGGKRARVHVATGVKKKEQGMGTIFKRHEADEVRAAMKQAKKNKGSIVPMRPEQGHMSASVLDKERELVRTAKGLYGKKAGGKKISKLRKQSGEYDSIGKKKVYKKAEKSAMKQALQQKADARKQFRAQPKADQKTMIKQTKDVYGDMFV